VIREKTAVRIAKKMSNSIARGVGRDLRMPDNNVVRVEKKIVKAVRTQDTIEGKGVAKMRKANVRKGVITGVNKTKVILALGREVEIVVDC
jgi:hypothetical protein